MWEFTWIWGRTHQAWWKCEMFVWSRGRGPSLIVVFLLNSQKQSKRRQSEVKRLLSIEDPRKNGDKKLQFKQMVQSGLESQPVFIWIERKWTAAGITHLGLSVQGPHRSLRLCIQSTIVAHMRVAVHGPWSYLQQSTPNLFVASFVLPGGR